MYYSSIFRRYYRNNHRHLFYNFLLIKNIEITKFYKNIIILSHFTITNVGYTNASFTSTSKFIHSTRWISLS